MKWSLSILILIFLAGCARTTRDGVISQELPITLDDLSEIRNGELNHEKVLWDYRVYQSPKLEKYCNAIAASLAEVSTRPNLPYRVVLLDDPEVNVFGGPGGYIYLTRGLFDFVESESELASVIAHEIIHVASFQYSHIPQAGKMQKTYDLFMKGAEFARDNAPGPYGSAARIGMNVAGKAVPEAARQFGRDEEIVTDGLAVEVLVKAGYDPEGYMRFIDRLSKVEMDDIAKFVNLMSIHPPFADRRNLLESHIKNSASQARGDIEMRKDMLSEVRQSTVNTGSDSIIFESSQGNGSAVPLEVHQIEQNKQEELSPYRKRWAWSS
jgi:predicted Zn-dependent protease